MLIEDTSEVTLQTQLLYEAPGILGLEYHRFFATTGELPTLYFRETTTLDETTTTFGPFNSLAEAASGLVLGE